MKSNEHIRRERAQKRLQELKRYRNLRPVYLIGTLVVIGLTYFAHLYSFPSFMVAMFLSFPIVIWFFYFSQQWMRFEKKPNALEQWEARQVEKYLESPSKEKSHVKWE